jgi:aldehyde dehydrogenase (NAD+)
MPAERRGGVDCDWLAVSEPKGVVLNIAPWNAPVLLSVLPVLGALAAGNACVIKPPDACPATSKLLKEIIASSVSPEAVTVVEGGPNEVNGLIDMGFDHIMFTGGTAIGRLIMARAARTLTPVTLELGGKNPVMIDTMDDAFLAAAIKEIVGTKAYFAGEFCQCHDIFLVVDSMWDKFTAALGEAVEALGDKRFVRMIHERHYTRVKRMLLEHKGQFLPSAAPQPDDEGLRLPVTAILEPHPDDFIMRDEVFGPCWAVLKVASVGEGITKAASNPTGKPLVSYFYGQSKENADAWMNGTSSGSLAINSGPMRMQSNFNAAIHGVGNSGLGGASIWGKHVFETFSHTKHVVRPKDGAFAGSIWGAGPYKPSA